MSFAVTYPFDESSYPSDLRSLWRNLPGPVKATLVEVGRKFGSHAMVQGAVPVLFAPEVEPLLAEHIDSRYIQRIPAVYKEVSGKLWVDADVLNYAAALSARRAQWTAIAVPGTETVCLSNVGGGGAEQVAIAAPEAAVVMVTGRASMVESNEGLLLSFATGMPRPTEMAVEWTGEDALPHSEIVKVPRRPVCPSKQAALQSRPSAMAGVSAPRKASAVAGSKEPLSLANA